MGGAAIASLLSGIGGRSSSRLQSEISLARREIREGRFQRTMALLAAFSAIVSGFEAYAQHLRGAFSNWLMWTPIALAPPVAGAAAATLISKRAGRTLLPVVSLISLLDGLVGFIYHVRGIRRLPGGFQLGQYNLTMGPPIFAPLLVGIVGTLGLIASGLRREVSHLPPVASRARQSVRAELFLPSNPFERAEVEVCHGRFQQGMAMAAALFALISAGEAYTEHLRGSFNQRLMWLPIFGSLPLAVVGPRVLSHPAAAHGELRAASALSFFTGVLGFYLHLRGLKRMPGGFSNLSFSVIIGPPLFAPLLFTASGLLGLTASLLRRAE